MRPLNIGLSEEQRQGVVNLLNQDLSDAYLLVIKTKKYHWDVVGPQFRTLHQLWEEHYEAISENIDAYAERVRALGGYPVGTAEGFLKHATLREHPGDLPNANEMVARLVVVVTDVKGVRCSVVMSSAVDVTSAVAVSLSLVVVNSKAAVASFVVESSTVTIVDEAAVVSAKCVVV